MGFAININEVRKALRGGFEEESFKYDGKGGVSTRLGDNVDGWIGWSIGHGRRSEKIDIMLHVGVSLRQLENLVDTIAGEADGNLIGMPLTIRQNLNYLIAPDCPKPWYVSNENELSSVLEEMRIAVRLSGLPFMRSYATVGAVLPLLDGCDNRSIAVRWRRQRLAALVILGQVMKARRLTLSRDWVGSKKEGKSYEQILDEMIVHFRN